MYIYLYSIGATHDLMCSLYYRGKKSFPPKYINFVCVQSKLYAITSNVYFFFLFFLRISSNPIIICVRDQTTSKIITYLYRAYMYIAVEHVNNFPITLTIEWNDNGDICIHTGNPFSHHICAVLQVRTKQRKRKKKI